MMTGTKVAKEPTANGVHMQSNLAQKPILRDAATLDSRGVPFPAHKTLMTKLDEKASEKVELSRGTVWLLATVLVLAGVAFSYGSSVIGWVRDDQDQRAKTNQIQSTLEAVQASQERMNLRMERIDRDLQEQRIATAKKEGYELKAAEGDHK